MACQSLGFYDLMNIAEQNSEQSKRESAQVKFRSFTPSKNKKEDPKSKALSDNVRKFLAKQEEEKRREMLAAKERKEKLLALRSKDKKATKRVGQMLRMTKSANKSAIADAVNCLNDSLVDQQGEVQPDEDDYGYASQASQEWHNKLMEKYKTIKKSKPIPSSNNSNGIEVPEAKSLKDGHKSIKNAPNSSSAPPPPPPINKPPKKVVPPPPSYHELIAMASGIIKIPELEKPSAPKVRDKKKDDFEFGRPMSQKEKEEFLAEKALKDHVKKLISTGKIGANIPNSRPLPPPSSKKSKELPSKNQKSSSSSQNNSKSSNQQQPKSISSSSQSSHSSNNLKSSNGPISEPKMSHLSNNGSKSQNISREKQSSNNSIKSSKEIKNEPNTKLLNGNSSSSGGGFSRGHASKFEPERRGPNSNIKNNVQIKKEYNDFRPGVGSSYGNFGKKETIGTRVKVEREESEEEDEDEDEEEESIGGKKFKGRQVIESEEEYDSEMDDFIDDSECNPDTISAMIRSITGYDKRKYRPEDERDDCMETSVYDQMREESRSLKIGIQEDLEDMRMEQEELKRKEMMRKKARKNMNTKR